MVMSTLTDRVNHFIDSFLEHAVPQYYDAAKAHEYYLRTRELKGRQSGTDLTDNQKKAWSYSKSAIKDAHKEELSVAAEERKAEFDSVRESVDLMKEEIRNKLEALLTGLAEDTSRTKAQIDADRDVKIAAINGKLKEDLRKISERQSNALRRLAEKRKEDLLRISEDAEAEIDSLPEIPKGLSKENAAKFSQERNAKIDKIRGEIKTKKASVSEQYDSDTDSVRESSQVEKQEVRDSASSEKESVNTKATEEQSAVSAETADQKKLQRGSSGTERAELTTAVKEYVNEAKVKYEALKQDLVAKYEEAEASEYEAIKRTVR